MSLADVATTVSALLNTIHDALFAAAKKGRDDKLVTVTKWEDFVPALEKQCLVMTPFCDQKEWEEKVKVRPARRQNMTEIDMKCVRFFFFYDAVSTASKVGYLHQYINPSRWSRLHRLIIL